MINGLNHYMTGRLNFKEGARRLRIIFSVVTFFIAYVYFYSIEYRVSHEELFIKIPFLSILTSVGAYLTLTALFWVLRGFFFDKGLPKREIRPTSSKTVKANISPTTYATMYINNVGTRFETFCQKHDLADPVQRTGHLYAWSLLSVQARHQQADTTNTDIDLDVALLKILKADDERLENTSSELFMLRQLTNNDAKNSGELAAQLIPAITESVELLKGKSGHTLLPVLNDLFHRKGHFLEGSKIEQLTDNGFYKLFEKRVSDDLESAKMVIQKIIKISMQ